MSANPALNIEHWAAWAPGLDTEQAWRDWLARPCQGWPGGADAVPALGEVPPMVRRRIDALGRAALQVAYRAQQDLSSERVQALPLVFASRWGELPRSLGLLQDLARAQPLSPTAFSHSVHNAVAAQYSIQRGIRANVSAVAAGAFSLEAGWMEAAALIADGCPEVLVVSFEADLPQPYPQSDWAGVRAIALRLSAAPRGGVRLQAAADSAPSPAEPAALPPDLQALRFLLTSADSALVQGPWLWSRS